MSKTTVPVSPKAVARIKRARRAGFDLCFFTFGAHDNRGQAIFAAAQVGDEVFGIRPDGDVVRMARVSS